MLLSEFLISRVTPASITSGEMVSLVGGRFDALSQYDVSLGSSSRTFFASVTSPEILVFQPEIYDTGNYSVAVCSHGFCLSYCCLLILPQLLIQSFHPNVVMGSFDLIFIRCAHSVSALHNDVFLL